MSGKSELEQVDRRAMAWGLRWRHHKKFKVSNANRAAMDREWLLFRAYDLASALELLLQAAPVVDTNTKKAREVLSRFDGRQR